MDCTFIHGMNNDAGVWDPVIESMAGSLGVVHAPQLSASPSVTQLAREVEEDAPRGVLIGHSFGGAVAQELATLYPQKVTGLVLVAATIGADSPEQATARRARVNGLNSYEAYIDSAMSSMPNLYHPANVDDAHVRCRRRASIELYGLERFRAHMIAASDRADRTEAIRSLDIPVLVIAPEVDAVIAPERQEAFASTVGAQFRQVDRTGHMLPAEAPGHLGKAIQAWAEEHHLSQ